MDSNKADEIAVINVHRGGIGPVGEFSQVLSKLVTASTTPMSAGGGVKSNLDIDQIMGTGVEKISIPVLADSSNIKLFTYCSFKYGNQAVQATLDYVPEGLGFKIRNAKNNYSLLEISNLALNYLDAGAGEIVLTNVTRDGSRAGLDFELLEYLRVIVNYNPILISGGVNSAENFVEAFRFGADGVISGTYIAKMDHSLLQLRSKIAVSGINVRGIA
jgi:cyclase